MTASAAPAPSAPSAAAPSAARGDRRPTPARLAKLREHVVVIPDGRPAATSVARPKTVAEFETTAADIERIVTKHLTDFVDAQQGAGPVPVVVYAHGGLVAKDDGFDVADQQVDWWLENGVFPIEIVWETGALTAIADAWERYRPGGRRGWTDVTDGVIEVALRALGGRAVWEDMKLDAAAAVVDGGGGQVLARALAEFMKANGSAISLHAVGHSAGSIFHSHFVPAALEAGVPEFASVTFLAPAVRIDTFEKLLLPHAEQRRIGELSIFTMTDEKELDDSCLAAYRKSLLYLVSGSFEPERGAAILGIHQHLIASARTRAYLDGGDERLVLSPTGGDPRSRSNATTHGGFDDDADTMRSVAMRIAMLDSVTPFPKRAARQPAGAPADAAGRSADEAPLAQAEDATGTASTAAEHRPAQRLALCIGIDRYPEGDELAGAVADSRAWGAALDAAGFTVRDLHDGDATRDAMVSEIIALVSSARPGDSLVIQYAGHGTFVPDLDGDDEDRADEALCPVDFRSSRVILDDELAAVWDLIPEGAAVTLVFDCCHSGTASRRIGDQPPARRDGLRPRLAALTPTEQDTFRRLNGAPTEHPWQVEAHSRVVDSEPGRAPKSVLGRTAIQRREVLIAACADDQVAWESRGQGVFTRAALEVLGRGARYTNRSFVSAVIDALGPNRVQDPKLTADDLAADRVLFAPVLGGPIGHGSAGDDADPDFERTAETPEQVRTAAIVSILRATADLLEVESRRR
ncbi:caspase family protein [Agromyces intestinalis]|uniref:Caspase family protein n=1 Tax=Agromyces intestinalis TaxID=2592652 RepID=A0A5C1YL14_9MICO|nr:caspase family protein [Agromyces intestinalis]QEO15492.1 caspase family protein [Agromyces intestinalis]